MTLNLRERVDLPELMDQPDVERQSLISTLHDIRRLNGLLHWRASVVNRIAQFVKDGHLRQVRVLDIATGAADIPSAVRDWGIQNRVSVEIVATDFHPTTVSIASQFSAGSGLQFVRHDALRCPFVSGAFDIATLNLALHHFCPEAAIEVLREMGRVAQCVVVSDLVRSYPAYVAALGLAQLLRNRLSAVDGPISVRRAYTVAEIRELADRAGLVADVRPVFPFRVMVCATKAKDATWTT